VNEVGEKKMKSSLQTVASLGWKNLREFVFNGILALHGQWLCDMFLLPSLGLVRSESECVDFQVRSSFLRFHFKVPRSELYHGFEQCILVQ
jgi:hypothetical protein